MNEGGWVVPSYFVFDPANQIELSMVDFANRLIPKIHREICSDPIVDMHIRGRLVEAGEVAISTIPFSQFSNLATIPGILEAPVSSLISTFVNLKVWITEDVTTLKQEGFQVYRPLVCVFLGCSKYADNWRTAHHEPTDRILFRFAPNIFCFGSNIVPSNVIWEIASVGTSELKTLAANVMDGSVGVDVLAETVEREFITMAIRSPLHARRYGSPEFNIARWAPGITPVDLNH